MHYINLIELFAPEFNSLGKISSTSNSISVSNIKLENNGIIFVIVELLKVSIKGRV